MVITEEALDGLFRPQYRQYVLGKEVIRSTQCNTNLINELIILSKKIDEEQQFKVVSGKTLCANDFYEGNLKWFMFNFASKKF